MVTEWRHSHLVSSYFVPDGDGDDGDGGDGDGGDGDAPRKTWAAAKEHCKSLGASLALITSAGQNAEAMAVMASRGLDDAWIGLNDLFALERTYVWLDTSISERPQQSHTRLVLCVGGVRAQRG